MSRTSSSDARGRRRRSQGGDPLRKTGYQLRQSVIDAVRSAVEQGAAESQNAFVERAVVRELRELRRQRVYAAYAEAAADPEFLADMSALTEALDPTVGDGLEEPEI
ncbi:MAG: hypothetical protein M3P24_06140 [Gemmatimonadota bacterium]|nr:hypothetical protein [Gemmatimonadota bacterium]